MSPLLERAQIRVAYLAERRAAEQALQPAEARGYVRHQPEDLQLAQAAWTQQ